MNKKQLTALVGGLVIGFSSQSLAWNQPTHKQIVKDALSYMGSSMATSDQRRAYNVYVAAAGSEERAGDILGQASFDVDDFHDTHLGEWWRGYEVAPLGGLASFLVNYTSYWHFQNHTRSGDEHGNDFGGYDYRFHTENGAMGNGETFDIDWWARTYLHNAQLKDSDYDTTEAHYRQGTFSTRDQYEDFQRIPFQPADNMGQYWFDQFRASPSLQTIGFSLHAVGDLGQPHHVYATSANHHSGWEGWAEDFYHEENLADLNRVASVIGRYDASDSYSAIVTSLGAVAYQHPEPLFDTSHGTRTRVARTMIPHTIAATVTVLTKGINYLYGED